jgi:hypothetical protein
MQKLITHLVEVAIEDGLQDRNMKAMMLRLDMNSKPSNAR